MYNAFYSVIVEAGNVMKSNEASCEYNVPFKTHYHFTHLQIFSWKMRSAMISAKNEKGILEEQNIYVAEDRFHTNEGR